MGTCNVVKHVGHEIHALTRFYYSSNAGLKGVQAGVLEVRTTQGVLFCTIAQTATTPGSLDRRGSVPEGGAVLCKVLLRYYYVDRCSSLTYATAASFTVSQMLGSTQTIAILPCCTHRCPAPKSIREFVVEGLDLCQNTTNAIFVVRG